MALRKLRNIRAGMVLKDPAYNPDGQILLPAGETITKNHLEIFKMWGVVYVSIERDSFSNTEEEIAFQNLYQKNLEQRKPYFSLVDLKTPIVKSILEMTAERLTEKVLYKE